LRPGAAPRPGPDPPDPLDAQVRAGRHVLHAPPVRPRLVLLRVRGPPHHRGRSRGGAPLALPPHRHHGRAARGRRVSAMTTFHWHPEVALGLEALVAGYLLATGVLRRRFGWGPPPGRGRVAAFLGGARIPGGGGRGR